MRGLAHCTIALTPVGSRFYALRGSYVSWDKNGQATTARKVVVCLLSGCRPNSVPPQGTPIFGLTMKLVLIKLVLLDKEDLIIFGHKAM